MRLIKDGDIEKVNPLIRFECVQCGCIFEEYKSRCSSSSNGSEYRATHSCPTCGNPVTIKLE